MDVKSTLKAITLELRRELEGKYDAQGTWQPGDLERRLAAIGVRRDRAPVPVDELTHLAPEDREARRVVDTFLQSRAEAGQSREAAIAEFVRDAAYTWANRPLALRCMEALLDRRGDPPEGRLRRPLPPAQPVCEQAARAVCRRRRGALRCALRRVFAARRGAASALRPARPRGGAPSFRRCPQALRRAALGYARGEGPGEGDGRGLHRPGRPRLDLPVLEHGGEGPRLREGPHQEGLQDRGRRDRPGDLHLHRALHGEVPRPELARRDLDGHAPGLSTVREVGVLRPRRRQGASHQEGIAKEAFAERAREVFSDFYYAADPDDATFSEDVWYVSDLDGQDAPHAAVAIPYRERLAHFRDVADVADALSEGEYAALAERIAGRFRRDED